MAQCKLCRLRYDDRSTEDRARHRRMHDALLRGLRYRPARSDRVFCERDGTRIAVVTRESPIAQRRRAVLAFRLASREMRYTGSGYTKREPEGQSSHAFLLYRRGRLIGLFILARCDRWTDAAWNDEEPNGIAELSGWTAAGKSIPEGGPLWSVDFMWIARDRRRQGYGRLLLECAGRFLGAPPEEFGWLPPFTAFGKAFIRHVQPQEFRAAR